MRSPARLAVFVMVLAAHAGVLAQSNTSTVIGTLKDAQGLALPGASIELVNEETGVARTATSAVNASFTITAVPQGRYTLKVTLEGFKSHERRGIQLTANETFDAGVVTLDVGSFTEVTTVTADVAAIQTGSSEISSVLEAKSIDALIARGRDPMSFFRAMPGVSVSGDGPVSLGGTNGTGLPNISGLPSNLGGITLDGMATNDADTNNQVSTIGVDAIEEIKVISNNYQAEFGRAAGASMSIISKSGTRDFHGSYAYFVRNEDLNANDYFNKLNGLPKPFYRYNTGSGTIGGPIGRPRAANKLFFFFAREDWATDEPRAVSRTTMPTDLERQGDFSQTVDLSGRLIPIVDPVTRQQFPGNRIPADRISQSGLAILNLLPLPNFFDIAVSARNYNYQYQDIAHTTKAMNQLKVDYNATTNDRITALLRNWDPLTVGYSGLFGVDSNFDQLRHNYAKSEVDFQVKHVRTIGKSMVNEISVSARRTHEIYTDPDFEALSVDRLGLSNLPQLYPDANPFGIFPQVSFGGVPSAASIAFDARFPINAGDVRRAVSDTFSWTAATHLVKAGMYYEWNYNSEGLNGACYSGCFAFGTDTNNPSNSGYAFSNAILGSFLSYSQSNQRVFRGGVGSVLEGFVQDSWKPRNDLTLELGLRLSSANPWSLDTLHYGWDRDVEISQAMGPVGGSFVVDRFRASRQPRLFRPAIVGGQRVGLDLPTAQVVPAALIGSIVPNSGDTFNGMVTEDDPLAETGFRNVPPPQLAPRFGFSYDFLGRGKTAIRGGFGITRQTITNSGSVANTVAAGPPARVQPTVFYGNIATLGQSSGYLAPFAVDGFTEDWTPTTVYNYSVNVQQNLGFSTILSVAYVGNRARYLPLTKDINVIPPGARFDPANIDPTNNRVLPDAFLRPMLGYAAIRINEDSGESDYNALQLTLTRRFKNGLQYAVAYTLSSTHDMAGTVPLYRDAREYLYDYAGFDQRHVLAVNYVWEIPNGSRLWNNVVTRAVLDKWQLAGVTTFASGRPSGVSFTTTDSADILGGGDPGRIVVTCDPNLPRGDHTFSRFFDTSCFARPPRGDAGNASRAVVRLPGGSNWDLTLSKMLFGRQGRGLQFRAEFYNAFNQVVWTNVNTAARFDPQGTQVNAQFGQVISTASPRVIQLAVRAMF
jgi:Carboxypeptidase regulatory-like domain/TonB-dependent Receptor Plug Domain